MSGHPKTSLAIESWTLYAVGVCLIISRLMSRLTTLGSVVKLQPDDWIMIIVLVLFTATVVCANGISADGKQPQLETIRSLKMRFAVEELQITTNWLVKACLLILYRRIFPASTNRIERLLVYLTAAYCSLSYVIIQILLPLWCNPARDYWAPSSSNVQCSTYRNHSITILTFSLTTTLATLILPVPLIPTPRRLLLSALLLLGTFAFVAGILARYYTLVNPNSPAFLLWYIAETALLIVFANLPFLSSLIASTAPRQLRNSLSRNTWVGRSSRYTTTLRIYRERFSSDATTLAHLSPRQSQRLSSITTLSPPECDGMWSDTSTPISVPQTPVRKLTLTDPPPELEHYCESRRSSTREADIEKIGIREPQWPLR